MYELEKKEPMRQIWKGLGQAKSSSVKVTHNAWQLFMEAMYDQEPKLLDPRAETGVPPSQPIRIQARVASQREPGRLKLKILASPEFNINKTCMN